MRTFFLPAVHGYFAVLRIGTQDDFLASVHAEPFIEQFRVFNRHTAQRNHLRPVVESDYQIFIALDAPAEINFQRSLTGYTVKHPIVYHVLRSRTIQIDHMQALDAVRFKFFRHLYRIFIIYLFGIVIALRQTDTFSINQVDSRNQFYHSVIGLEI